MALIKNPIFSFLEDQKLYENEVCLKVIFQIIKLIFVDEIVYFNIFGKRFFTPTLPSKCNRKMMTFYS